MVARTRKLRIHSYRLYLKCIFPYFLLFSHIFVNFAVEKCKNRQHLGNSNKFDCSRFAPSLSVKIFISNEKSFNYFNSRYSIYSLWR